MHSRVSSVVVTYKELGYGSFYLGCRKERKLNTHEITEILFCCNPLCVNGGFSIGEIIRDMVRKNETNRDFHVLCCGNEGSALGGRFFKKCYNSFKGNISISYL